MLPRIGWMGTDEIKGRLRGSSGTSIFPARGGKLRDEEGDGSDFNRKGAEKCYHE